MPTSAPAVVRLARRRKSRPDTTQTFHTSDRDLRAYLSANNELVEARRKLNEALGAEGSDPETPSEGTKRLRAEIDNLRDAVRDLSWAFVQKLKRKSNLTHDDMVGLSLANWHCGDGRALFSDYFERLSGIDIKKAIQLTPAKKSTVRRAAA